MVVEPRQQRAEDALDIVEVDHPAGVRVDGAADGQFDPVGMPVHPVAAVGLGHIRQPVGRLEGEGLGDLHGVSIEGWSPDKARVPSPGGRGTG